MLNRQLAFDRAVKGLNEQKAYSVLSQETDPDQGCAYRGEGGLKCGIGFLIPDEKYDPNLESLPPTLFSDCESTLMDDLGRAYTREDIEFLNLLQNSLHDSLLRRFGSEWPQKEFEQAVAHLAEEYKLDNPLEKTDVKA